MIGATLTILSPSRMRAHAASIVTGTLYGLSHAARTRVIMVSSETALDVSPDASIAKVNHVNQLDGMAVSSDGERLMQFRSTVRAKEPERRWAQKAGRCTSCS